MPKKVISIVIPIHNEQECVPILLSELRNVTQELKTYAFEFVLVDDGSTDQSLATIKQQLAVYPEIHLVEFARNFGKEAAVSAGIHQATGQAVIIMDADLQHPPQKIPDFIKKWEQGAEVVVGIRKADGKESRLKRLGSVWFYRIMRWISHTEVTPHATDYRLLDRCVVNEFNRLTERNRMTRGLIDWLGFRRDYVDFVAATRQHGEASYTFSKLTGLAINSFTAYSMLPLRLAGYLGIFILLIATPAGAFVLIEQYIMGDPLNLNFSGSASLGLAVLFLVGIVLVCLGLVALYIAHIHTEVIGRPLYIVRANTEDEEKP